VKRNPVATFAIVSATARALCPSSASLLFLSSSSHAKCLNGRVLFGRLFHDSYDWHGQRNSQRRGSSSNRTWGRGSPAGPAGSLSGGAINWPKAFGQRSKQAFDFPSGFHKSHPERKPFGRRKRPGTCRPASGLVRTALLPFDLEAGLREAQAGDIGLTGRTHRIRARWTKKLSREGLFKSK